MAAHGIGQVDSCRAIALSALWHPHPHRRPRPRRAVGRFSRDQRQRPGSWQVGNQGWTQVTFSVKTGPWTTNVRSGASTAFAVMRGPGQRVDPVLRLETWSDPQ